MSWPRAGLVSAVTVFALACAGEQDEVPALLFTDPVRAGQRFGDLVVTAVDLQPAPGVGGVVGGVDLEGTVELRGRVGPHPADPESTELCFFPDTASAALLPRLPEDERYSWFCFTNADAARNVLADAGRADGDVAITIDRYGYRFSYSDVFNTARLDSAATVAGRSAGRPR